MQEEERTTLGKPVELSGTKCICEPGLKFNNLYNKRACSQTMFKILRLRRQHCQIKRKTGLQKTFWQERERAGNKNPGLGRGDTCNARVGPTSL
jgi:hypothetical protein